MSGLTKYLRKVKLTDAQHDVLLWLGQGKSAEEIAIITSRSEKGVRNSLNQLKHKLKARNGPNLVAHGIIGGFVGQHFDGETLYMFKTDPRNPDHAQFALGLFADELQAYSEEHGRNPPEKVVDEIPV